MKYLRMLLFALAALFAAALPAATAKAAQHDINYGNWIGYENEDGTLTLTGCRSVSEYMYDNTLTVPTEVEGKKVTAMGIYIGEQQFYIFDHPDTIENLILPDTIEHVDKYEGEGSVSVFSGYNNLKKVVLPDNETFNEDDVDHLFRYNNADVKELSCRSDDYIVDKWKDTLETVSLHYVGGYFGGSVYGEMPNLKTLSIRESKDAGKNLTCYSLPTVTDLTLPSGIKKLELHDCPALTGLSLPGSLERMWLADCAELSTLECEKALKDISIESVYNCPKLSIPAVYLKYGENDGNVAMVGIERPPYAGSRVQEIHIDSRRIANGLDKKFFRDTPNLKAIVIEGNSSKFFSKNGVLYYKATGRAPDGSKISGSHLFAYPAAKSTSGNLNIPVDVTCIYAYALDGCKFSTVTFPENMHPYYEWDSVLLEPYSEGNWASLPDLCSAKFRMVKNSSPDDGMTVPGDRLEYYKGSAYKITYKLSGGKNSGANPSSYTAGEELTLKNPSRSGYTFLGWTRNDSKSAADYRNTTKRERYFTNYTFTAHWMRITGVSKKIAAGKNIKLTAEFVPANAKNPTVSWSSSNKNVATVSKNGVVTFKKNSGGKSVTITAKANGRSAKKTTFKLTSMKGVVKKVKISGKSSLKAGKSVTLKAKVTASAGANKTLSWSSSNKKYATVSGKGKVTAKKAGKGKKVTITAKATDGSGKKAAFKIKIK